jgi:hypothetical protein
LVTPPHSVVLLRISEVGDTWRYRKGSLPIFDVTSDAPAESFFIADAVERT